MTLRRRLVAAGFAASVALAPVTVLTSGYLAAPAAVAAPTASSAATSAGTWLAGQFTHGEYYTSPYTNKADVSGTADLVVGLLASGTGQTTATSADAWLKTQAPGVTSAGQLAKLAIVASAMGDNPASYGGVDLVTKLTAASAASVSNKKDDPYSDALTIIALNRDGQAVPTSLVDALVARQDAAGEFFFGTAGTSSYFTDPDATGIAMQALTLVKANAGASATLTKADAWATSQRTSQGYWASYSPVNTTGLIGSALLGQGVSVSASVTWMIGQQQLAGGSGLPASLNGTHPDAYATAQGLLLLGGRTLATVTFVPATTATPSPSATPSAASSSSAASASPSTTASAKPLPATGDGGPGSSTDSGLITLVVIGAASVGLVAAGAARARRHS